MECLIVRILSHVQDTETVGERWGWEDCKLGGHNAQGVLYGQNVTKQARLGKFVRLVYFFVLSSMEQGASAVRSVLVTVKLVVA